MHLSNCNVATTEESKSDVSLLKYKWRKVSATRGFPQSCGRNVPRVNRQPIKEVVVCANGEPRGSVVSEKGDFSEGCGRNAPLVDAESNEVGVSFGLVEYLKVETDGAFVKPSSIEQSGSSVNLEVATNSGQNESSQLLKPSSIEFPQNCAKSAPRVNVKPKKVGVVSAKRRFPRGCGRNAPPMKAKSNDDGVSVENMKVDTDGAFIYSVEQSGSSPELGNFEVIESPGQVEPPHLPKVFISETTNLVEDFNQVEAPKRTKILEPMVVYTPKSLVMVEPVRSQNAAQVNPTPKKGGVVSVNRKFHDDVLVENSEVETDVPLVEPSSFKHTGSSVELGDFEMTEFSDRIVSPQLPNALILETTNAPEVLDQMGALEPAKALEPLLVDTLKFSEMTDLMNPTETEFETAALLKKLIRTELFESVTNSDGPDSKDLLKSAVQTALPSSLVQLPVDSVLPETLVQLKVSDEPQTSDSVEAVEHNMHKKYPRRRISACLDFPPGSTINPPHSIVEVNSFIDLNVGNEKATAQTIEEQIVVDDAKQKTERIDNEDTFQSSLQRNIIVTKEIGDQAQVKLVGAVAKEMVDADVKEVFEIMLKQEDRDDTSIHSPHENIISQSDLKSPCSSKKVDRESENFSKSFDESCTVNQSPMQEYVGLELSDDSLIDQALVAAPNCPWNLRKRTIKSSNGLSRARAESKEKKHVGESCTDQSQMHEYSGLEISKKRVIVQAIMAAPNCPWNLVRQTSKSPSGPSHATVDRKGKEHDFVVQDDSKSIFGGEKAKVETSELPFRKKNMSTAEESEGKKRVDETCTGNQSQMQGYVGLEISNKRVIVQALMAAPNCPWNLVRGTSKSPRGLSHATAVRKETKHEFVVQDDSKSISGKEKAKAEKSEVKYRKKKMSPTRNVSDEDAGQLALVDEDDYTRHDKEDDSSLVQTLGDMDLSLVPFDLHPFIDKYDDSEADVTCNEVGESLQLVQTSHNMDLSSIPLDCHPLVDKDNDIKKKHVYESCTITQSLMQECVELEIPKKKVIVQALMAAANCPWNMVRQTSKSPNGFSNATAKRKGKKHEFVVQDDSKYSSEKKKAKVVKSEVEYRKKKLSLNRNVSYEGAGQLALVDEDDYTIHDKKDDSSLVQTSGDMDLSLIPFGLHPFVDKNDDNEADVTCEEVGESWQLIQTSHNLDFSLIPFGPHPLVDKESLIDQALVAAPNCPWNLRKRTIKSLNGLSHARVGESKEKKHVGGSCTVTQSQMQQYVGLEIPKKRVIVQALMAAPNCPWNMVRQTSKSPSGLSNAAAKRKGKKHEFLVQDDSESFSGRKKAKVVKSEVKYRKEKMSPTRNVFDECVRRLALMDEDDYTRHDKEDDSSSVQTSHMDISLISFGLHPFIDKNEAGVTCNEVGEFSHSIDLSLIPFGCHPLANEVNDNEAGVTRNRVRETLRLFQGVVRKLLQDAESKSKDVQANGSVRVDLLSAKILKEKNKWVNTGKQILGAVPGVEIGDEFHYRVELAIVGLHRLYQSGIDYLKMNGIPIATSVVASGGYNDVMDSSDVLVYSGQGGNPTDGSKKAEDQKLERGNLSLKNSIDEQSPVRVIRGFKETKGNGKVVATYAYDGLYSVEKYWEELGCYGTKVFKFQLKRIPGQPELAIKEVKKSKKSRVREGLCVYDISQGKEKIPICAINTVDDEKPPSFEYITKMIYPSWHNLTLPDGCSCTRGCSDSENCSCAKKNGGEIPFNYDGAIVEAKALVYECGPSCKCPPSCPNRVSQRGITFQLEIFKTESRGWGVRSLNSIPSGSFICEYTGELLQDEEAERRTGNDEYLFDIGHNYNDHALWDGLSNLPLDSKSNSSSESVEEEGYTIDAAQYGSVGRFINHSCSPNIYAQNVLYDHNDKSMPRIMFFASENIPPLQELTYHYNYELDQVRDSEGNIKKKNCYCGSPECTGRMY